MSAGISSICCSEPSAAIFHQPVAVAARLQDLLEDGADFDHFGAVHNVADKDIGEYRFDTRGAAGDDGKRVPVGAIVVTVALRSGVPPA